MTDKYGNQLPMIDIDIALDWHQKIMDRHNTNSVPFPSPETFNYVARLLNGEIKSPPILDEHRNGIIQSSNAMIQSYLIEGDGDITLYCTGGFVK